MATTYLANGNVFLQDDYDPSRTQTVAGPRNGAAQLAAIAAFYAGQVTPPPILTTAPILGTLTQLFVLSGANMNTTADQVFVQQFQFSKYVVSFVVAANPSISLTAAAGGIYTGASKGGSAIILASQVYSGLKTASDAINPQVATAGQQLLSQSGVYLSLTTPQGAAATADLFIMGIAG